MHFDPEPRHIFTTLVDPAILLARTPPAIIPDFMGSAAMPPAATARSAPQTRQSRTRLPSRMLLWDVKTINAGSSWYNTPRARDDQAGAVAARAHAVNGGARGGEYGAHARRMDEDLHHTSTTGLTPIADRLGTFTQVRGLVFGAYGEANVDVHSLIQLAAHELARKHWRQAGARSEGEARSFWVGMCRRRIGVAATRAMARHRIRRTVFVGVPRAVLDDRARRGVAATGADRHPSEDDLHALYAHQRAVAPLAAA